MAYDPESSRLLWEQAAQLAPPRGSQPERAIELLKQALEKDPRNVFAYSSLARLYLGLGEFEKAQASCMAGLGVQDLPAELRSILGHVANPLEQKADDLKFYLLRIRLKTGQRADAEALLQDLKTYSEAHGKGRYEEALKLLQSLEPSGLPPTGVQGDKPPIVWRSIWGEHAFRAQVELSLKYPGKERVTAGGNAIRCLSCDTATALAPCSNCGSSAYDFGLSTDRVIGLFCSSCRRGFTSVRCIECGTENPITHETVLHRGTEKKGGCFIATAVMGTQHGAELALLCAFRDHFLLPSPFGNRFVETYYRLSPPLAERLEKSRVARAFVRRIVILPVARLLKAWWLRGVR